MSSEREDFDPDAAGSEASAQSPAEAPARPPAPAPAPAPSDEEDFGRMLKDSLEARSFEDGETVEATVVAIWPDVAFLDIGGKSEMTIDIEELRDPDGELEVEVGDRIQAIVVSADTGFKLSRRLARGAALKQQLGDAFRAGLPVEGRVDKAIKGGYEVRIAGQRAFCPISQIDLLRTVDPSVHEGKQYLFRITEFGEGGKNLVVSRRALLEEEEREKATEVRRAIVPDAVLPGKVVSVRDYGAFVDLGGGVQGLLHVSEMGWSRVANPSEVVQPGDEITVKVLRCEGERISLGLKQLTPDPWSEIAGKFAVGQVVSGRVIRVTEFGAFVELDAGIEALAHVSTFAPTGKAEGWKASVPTGWSGAFEILSVEPERKRIGVAMVPDGSVRAREAAGEVVAEKTAIVAGARLTGKVERHEKFGFFVFLLPGRTGLVPLAETGTPRGADLKKAFPVGSDIEVAVLEVDPSGRRIRLSRRAVLEAEERSDAREFESRQERQQEQGFGSLADKLRSALRKPG